MPLNPELRRPREIFFAHAKVLEVQTLAVYGGVGVFINSTKRKPSWQALPPKGLVHRPIKHPVLLHSRSGFEFMQRYYCSMFLPKLSVCLCIVVPHAAQSRNHVVRVHHMHCSTCLPTPPIRVRDMSSVLCYMLCLFTRCSSCFDSHPRHNCVSIFTRVLKTLWVHVEGKFEYLRGCVLGTVQEMCSRDTYIRLTVKLHTWQRVADSYFSGCDYTAN